LHKIGTAGTKVKMVNASGFKPGVRHGERLESLIHQAVPIQLPQIAMVCLYEPIGIIDLGQTVKCADFGLYGNTRVLWRHAGCLAFKMIIKTVVFNDFRGFFVSWFESSPRLLWS
jgi:hypothetical protein